MRPKHKRLAKRYRSLPETPCQIPPLAVAVVVDMHWFLESSQTVPNYSSVSIEKNAKTRKFINFPVKYMCAR
jgi:hypothetical protein